MTTDRTILPDDWEERDAERQYSFWNTNHSAHCDILSNEALHLAWNTFGPEFYEHKNDKHFRHFLAEIVAEIGRRPGCGILVPEEVTTFLVSKRLAGSL